MRLRFVLEAASVDQEAYIVARIEERAVGSIEGRILAQSAPQRFDDGASLLVPDVPNGNNRVAIIELIESGDPQSRVLLYGVSERFELSAGQDETVDVPVTMRAPPGAVGLTVPAYVSSSTVTLRLTTTESAVKVRISDQADLISARTREFPLAVGSTTHDVDWRLDEYAPCEAPDFCLRRVYARFFDDFEYGSEVLLADVVIDSTAPSIVPGTAELGVSAPPGSLRSDVSALGLGGRARVSFTTSEPLVTTPTVAAVGPGVRRLRHVAGRVASFTYELVVDDLGGSDPDGAFAVEVEMRDEAGNTAVQMLDLGGLLVIDTTVPPPPDTMTPGAVVFTRRPWGADETGGQAVHSLRGGAASADPSASIVVYDRADVTTAVLLDRFDADDTGAFEGTLASPVDRETVYVVAVDTAGNKSDVAEVRDVTWVAGMGTSGLEPSPHEVRAVTAAGPYLVQRDALVAADQSTSLAARDADGVSVSGRPQWREHVTWAPIRDDFDFGASAFDTSRNRLVLYGAANASSEIVALENGRWRTVAASKEAPPARARTRMVYDAGRDAMFLFGGYRVDTLQELQDVWEWDGERWLFHQPSFAPSARDNPNVAYDSSRGRTILFGGHDFVTALGDTWEWDGSSWERVVVTGPRPSPRTEAAFAYDPDLGGVVLFGGCDRPSTFLCDGVLDDTWVFDGTWRQITTTSRPPARRVASLVHDAAGDRTLLIGGFDVDEVPIDDVWALENGNWTQVTTTSSGPSARGAAAVGFDRSAEDVIVAAGCGLFSHDCAGRPRDTWRLGDDWVPVDTSTTGLASLVDVVLEAAYDNDRARGVALGILDVNTPTQRLGVAEWDGVAWSLVETATTPPFRVVPGFTHDPVGGGILMYGGRTLANEIVDDHWRWDGTSWRSFEPLGPRPQPSRGPIVATDEPNQRVLLFGFNGTSSDPGRLWAFDGTRWSIVDPGATSGAPNADVTHQLAVLPNGRVVLSVTRGPQLGYWRFDGSRWEAAPPAVNAPDRALVYDPVRARLLGLGGGYVQSYDGVASVQDLTAPGAMYTTRSALFGFYDAARSRPLLVGARADGRFARDTWTMEPDRADRKPALRFVVDMSSVGAVGEVTAIEVNASIGGDGVDPQDAPIDGALVAVWNASASTWQEKGSTNAAFTAPADVSAVLEDTPEQYLVGASNAVQVRFEPRGARGSTAPDAAVRVEFVEVRVRYRRP